MKQPWTLRRITQKLRQLHREGVDLSYNALSKTEQALVSAAAYHCGSYRQAVVAAGIDYGQIARRPHWSKAIIIKLIKKARREKRDLNWGAVSTGTDQLHRAAFAALQPRLFGSWSAALKAAGLKLEQVSRYRAWSKETLVKELRRLGKAKAAMNSGAVQKSHGGLHAAAVRYFGAYDAALKAAGLDPGQLRQRRRWTRPLVIEELKAFAKKHRGLVDGQLRQECPPLYGATIRLFKNMAAAKRAVI